MVSKKLMLTIVLGILLLAGCSGEETKKIDGETDTQTITQSLDKENPEGLTKEEVTKHDNTGDCWIIVDDSVYDVTSLITNHQAKETQEACGRSMEMLLLKEKLDFDNIGEAKARLQDYKIGNLN